MISFTIDGIKKLGDYDDKYGQRYWAQTPEGDLPLMFNSMAADLEEKLLDGPLQIVAEEKSERESAKGNPYLSLKKVKLVERTEASESKITPELVKETFGDEKPAQKPTDVGMAFDEQGGVTLPPVTELQKTIREDLRNQNAQSQLDRIEAQLQELQSSVDRLLG